MRVAQHHIFRFALVIASVALVVLAVSPIPESIGQSLNDKLSHALAFYVLALLTDFSFPGTRFTAPKVFWLLAFGLAVEFIQSPIPYRYFSAADLIANAVGVFLYPLTLPLLRRAPVLQHRWEQID